MKHIIVTFLIIYHNEGGWYTELPQESFMVCAEQAKHINDSAPHISAWCVNALADEVPPTTPAPEAKK